ncbi:CaiB/BaiF CoA transferase family protein [Lampropedia aestuarii]|uniref:CaiB/BaiF CoA transferase family protein n=1 Tax=Lampropedia aestuarii TaxID=2562762 RepID=UPI002468A84D|nr:CaiB/BaiF CoA-transferase family protein [Lampropedia aestuarii]MDH5856469.1 CaiB/BaiF CoA-transferase family protein [Lampropedia aestuarii]
MSSQPHPSQLTGRGPLESIVVLSLAEQLPGPYATLILADLGAEVLQIERPGSGDPARAFPDYYAAIARNKKSICLDLKTEADRQSFYQLVERADVVMEGFSPGTTARLGVDYKRLQAINSRLIYVSISGFGQTGPHRARPAHDLSFQAIAGALASMAPGEEAPDLPLGDMTAATFAALAVTTALAARASSGHGSFVDVAMADCLTSWMTPLMVPRLNGGRPIDVTASPGYGVFACQDGLRIALSIAHEDHFWSRLCRLLNLPYMDQYSHAQRLQHRAEFRQTIARALQQQPRAHWTTQLDQAGVPWSPVYTLEEVPLDAQLDSRGLFETVASGDGSTQVHIRQPLKFSGYGQAPLSPAPALGEHQALLDGLAVAKFAAPPQ